MTKSKPIAGAKFIERILVKMQKKQGDYVNLGVVLGYVIKCASINSSYINVLCNQFNGPHPTKIESPHPSGGGTL
jgi:hypothetical protein